MALFGKVGQFATEEVIVLLISSKCMPANEWSGSLPSEEVEHQIIRLCRRQVIREIV